MDADTVQFTEVLIAIDEAQAEVLSDLAIDLGALSVSVEDADADTDDEQPLFGEPGLEPVRQAWVHSRVVILLGDGVLPDDFVATLRENLGDVAFEVTIRSVENQDWVRLTQSQFDPIPIGQRIWVVPSWHVAPEQADAIILELDPGLAFGTGSHPTTRLCMTWLEAELVTGQTVLDYGCGSGILAIVAKKLGAAETLGIDIDPNAILSAADNTQNNQVDVKFYLPDDAPIGQFDVVVANILSNPLKVMAAMLCERVRVGGRLVLSGVLARQTEEVCAAYAPWLSLSVWREEEGWVCLHGQRG
jgi:ribosomal protein L11 methyltransferase